MSKVKLRAQIFSGVDADESVVRVNTLDGEYYDFLVKVEHTNFGLCDVELLETNHLSASVRMPGPSFDYPGDVVRVYFDDLEFVK